ncbi:MAG TPA: ABC-three component system protein [Candidatus Kapabacteria bacterium]|nr:ABC-three component system protein [Candidatus Kapabacteria bacterium]
MMRTFPLYDLHWQELEKLAILICERVLGIGTINFSAGVDGGRDGKFTGKAENFPSKTSPWEGRFIIQVKHTQNPIAKCSDPDFKKIIEDEVTNRLKALVDNKELDYYLIFTNRKMSGNAEARITDFINTNLDIENRVIGEERIQLWLQKYPDIVKILNLNNLFLRLEFYEKDLRDIIIEFSKMKSQLVERIEEKQTDIKWLDKVRKNELNNLNKDYFDYMKKNSLAYFHKIEAFLKDPANLRYKDYYENTISDLQGKNNNQTG